MMGLGRAKSGLGVGFTGAPYGVREVVRFAKLAEREGFSSFWFAEDYFLRDAISNIACVALSTGRIKISTGVINPFTRNPALIAQTVATISELSRGRARLALGTGVRPLLESAGVEFVRPLEAMKEAVEIIRRLLKGERVDYLGRTFSARGVKLWENPYFALLDGPFKPSKVPIYVAAIGPKMLELAGAIGDGVLFTAGFGVESAREAISRVRAGAEKKGRSFAEMAVGNYIIACLGKPARGIRGFLAFDVAYARPENLTSLGVPESEVAQIRSTLERKGIGEAARLITRDVADLLIACGTKGEIQRRVEEYRKAGVSEPILLPMETDVAALMRGVS